MSGTILKKLTFDNETVSAVRHLIRWHDYQYGTTEKSIRKAVAKIGRDYMPMLFLVQFSDILSQNPSTFEGKLNTIYQAIEYWKKIIQSKAALELKRFRDQRQRSDQVWSQTRTGNRSVIKAAFRGSA